MATRSTKPSNFADCESQHERRRFIRASFREDNTPDSLPVITIGNLDRFSKEANYRSRCADRIIEIVLNIENYMGVGRIFIP